MKTYVTLLIRFVEMCYVEYCLLLLLCNGRSWIYSINLLASQYSSDNSLETLSIAFL